MFALNLLQATHTHIRSVQSALSIQQIHLQIWDTFCQNRRVSKLILIAFDCSAQLSSAWLGSARLHSVWARPLSVSPRGVSHSCSLVTMGGACCCCDFINIHWSHTHTEHLLLLLVFSPFVLYLRLNELLYVNKLLTLLRLLQVCVLHVVVAAAGVVYGHIRS